MQLIDRGLRAQYSLETFSDKRLDIEILSYNVGPRALDHEDSSLSDWGKYWLVYHRPIYHFISG